MCFAARGVSGAGGPTSVSTTGTRHPLAGPMLGGGRGDSASKVVDRAPCLGVPSTERGTGAGDAGRAVTSAQRRPRQVPLSGAREGRRDGVWEQSVPGQGAAGRTDSESLVCSEKFTGEEDKTVERKKKRLVGHGVGGRCHPMAGRELSPASWVIARPPPAPRVLGLRMKSGCQGRGPRATGWSPPGGAGP